MTTAYGLLDPAAAELAATSTFGMIGAVLGGLVIVGALIWAFWLGDKVRSREPRPPRPEEQPTLPDSGPVRETREMREPEEVPQATDEDERLRPYNLNPSGDRRSADQEPRRWDSGTSGSFGSGGTGKA
ncbi:DUF6479 family protein [Streptomyces sp. Da 82-17]|uniref:DUF6479 family protein n=1 Tax=Streptomyces sp. Da 82-17 TaxID=3377116 RepID=UPI0038D3EA2E